MEIGECFYQRTPTHFSILKNGGEGYKYPCPCWTVPGKPPGSLLLAKGAIVPTQGNYPSVIYVLGYLAIAEKVQHCAGLLDCS